MTDSKRRLGIFKKYSLQVVGFVVLILLAVLLLWFNNARSYQATSAFTAKVRFYGEYCIGDGPWQEIVEGQHIPATKGDVTLKGNFHLFAPDGEYIGVSTEPLPMAFYVDHINLTFRENGEVIDTIECENPLFKVAACGAVWSCFNVENDGTEPFEIVIHNPHRFGNEMAIDELLSNLDIWGDINFERTAMAEGRDHRNIGFLLIIISFILLGSGLFSALLKVKNNRVIWLLGAIILSAGGYLIYCSPGISFWSESVVINTTMVGITMMFYMLFISALITFFLKSTKKTGYITTVSAGVINGVYFVLPIVAECYFYDMLSFWAVTQTIANIILIYCLVKEYISTDNKNRWLYSGFVLLLLAFEADILATATGLWKGGVFSKYVFFILFLVALFVVLRIIPEGINSAEKAKELEMQRSRLEAEKNIMEAELKESRISIMLSQIQPHFIYNTLGTIERMCLKDPEKAFDLVRNFSLYLRGNFSELDSVTPIRFAEELKHIEYYVNIEKVRFPDMDIRYQVETTDFVIPALSVQPLVENAIKHGLMRLESGGTVVIRSYETDEHFCVEVRDDGVGFDTTQPIDGKKHVGLRNIRGRLKAMVNGELMLESKVGQGTKATIMIPKEVTE